MKKTIMPFVMAFLCMLLLFGCAPKQVENKEVEVVLNGSTRTCLYTGEYLKKPVGVGEYKFTEDGEEWTFKGESGEKSELKTGSVEDMPLIIKHNGKKYETFYTGELVDSTPVDPVQITDFPYTLEYEDEELDGLYTGSIYNNLPEGTGEFLYENKGDYFEYAGEWKAGELVGKGSIDSNCFIIHFPDVDRKGEYKGDVVDGLPEGHGSFSALNDKDVNYLYVGEWKNGLYDGQGKLVYKAENYYQKEGNFEKSEFAPNVVDFFKCMGTVTGQEYEYSDGEIDFIKNHESMFIGQLKEIDDSFIDKNFKYELFSKDESKFDKSIIKVAGLRVVQIYEEELWGYSHVFIIAEDSKSRIYSINMIGTAPEIFERSRIQIIAMPVDYFTYPNVAGTDIWAIACVGISVTKQ